MALSGSGDGSTGKREFSMPKCTTESVVVYLDRAQVCRSLKMKASQGEFEVVITDVSPHAEEDSIRVEGRGPAVINEVVYDTKYVTAEESKSNSSQVEDLKRELKGLEIKKQILNAELLGLQKQRGVLDGFADQVKEGPSDKTTDRIKLCQDLLDGMNGFFGLYDKQFAALDERLHKVKREVSENQEAVNVANQNLRKIGGQKRTTNHEVSVMLDVTGDDEIELFVSYVVRPASWEPKYDIRVFSEENKMKIMYYGMIKQSTGEDWEDAKIQLSTAQPSIGGTVPELMTQHVQFKIKEMPMARGMQLECAPASGGMMRMNKMMDYAAPVPQMCMSMAMVTESITSTIFEISRSTTIPSDNTAHKVSVGIIDLKPEFKYECVPKLANHAFLKAKAKNTSQYAFLAGPSSIFLDNNFIAKSHMDAVSPAEEFTCSLGVDPGIRIKYKPAKKFREQHGLMTKVNMITYQQVIEVKNTRRDNITILVADQLPLSTEEKIKVNLIEPQLRNSDKYDETKPVRLNKSNNIEWEDIVNASETKDIVLKYSIEFPLSEEIQF